MKFFIMILLFISEPTLACGFGGCYASTCLTYGANYLSSDGGDECAHGPVSHLDPNNWTESNFQALALELSGLQKPDPYSYDQDSEHVSLPTLPPEENRDNYWRGIAAFRTEDYIKAAEFFEKATLEKGTNSESAAYYLGRAYLRASQKDYDGYRREGIDKPLAAKARDAFRDFARKFETHPWAASAQGLIRRSEFLSSDWESYHTDWSKAVEIELAQKPRNFTHLNKLFEESSRIDLNKLTELSHLHPVLWLIRSYYVTRQFSDFIDLETSLPEFNIESQLKTLESDKASFTKYPDLYAWSKAVLLLKLNRAQEGYDLLQKQSVAKTNLGSLSWLVLNARLLMALGRYDEARAILEVFIKKNPIKLPKSSGLPYNLAYNISPGFSEDGGGAPDDVRNFYAMTYVWEGRASTIATKKNLDLITTAPLTRVFIQGSTPEEMVAVLSQKNLDPKLRTILEPLVMAKLIVMNKWSLLSVAYSNMKTKKTKKMFAEQATAASVLATDPNDPNANTQIGIFIASIESQPIIFSSCEKQKFGSMTQPMEFYLRALDAFKEDEKANKPKNLLEAKLLREMLACFKTRSGAPYCGEDAMGGKYKEVDLSIATRKEWFKRLKSRFPDSQEAKKTAVYW